MMIPDSVKEFIMSCTNSNGTLNAAIVRKKENDDMKAWLACHDITWVQVFWLVKMGLNDIPKCPVCGKPIDRFYGARKKTYCSLQCAIKSAERTNHMKQTCLMKYGVENPTQQTAIRQKQIATLMQNYGVATPLKNTVILEKVHDTIRKTYGVEHAMQDAGIKEKVKATSQERYGVEHFFMNADIKDKIRKTCVEKYGVPYFSQTQDYRDQVADYNIKHGTERTENSVLTRAANQYAITRKRLLQKNIDIITTEHDYPYMTDITYHCLICDNNFIGKRTYSQKIYCPVCRKYHGKSIAEKELLAWLRSIYHGNIIENARNILASGKELDIYIPDMKIAIEYNGDFWHTTKFLDANYHLNKTVDAEHNNIKLIHIFEHEWHNNRNNIKAYLKKVLDIDIKHIGYEECLMKEINEINLDKMIVIGKTSFDAYPVRRGLFYDNELVAIIAENDNKMCYLERENYHIDDWYRAMSRNKYMIVDRTKYNADDFKDFDIVDIIESKSIMCNNGYDIFNSGYMKVRVH